MEAVSTFGRELADIRVFSLGTTTDTIYRPPRLDRGGLFPWAGDALDVVLRGQSIGATNAATHLVGRQNLLRVDPRVPGKELRLDGISPDQLRGRAEHVSRHISQDFKQRFLDHRPSPYTPQPKRGCRCTTPQPTP